MSIPIEKVIALAFVAVLAFPSTQVNASATLPSFPYPAQVSEKQATTSGTWSLWNNVRVNVRGGVKLLDASGTPVRATKFRVYATDIDWQYEWPGGNTVTTPNGDGGSAASDYNFPGRPVEGIILYQAPLSAPINECALSAAAIDQNGSKVCNNFDPNQDIFVSVNDGTYLATDNTGHDDNGGSFDLHLKILQ